jgi:L-erythro-3,5-diaminohexanoate dehydrogenase
MLCDVSVLNVDSASFRQIAETEGGDAARIAAHVQRTVAERGKQHNPVTGSGGMFVGTIAEIGPAIAGHITARAGDRIASLVSLSLTPLHIETVERVDVATGRLWVRARAILFESAPFAVLPADIDEQVALAALDVAGAPAQIARLAKPGMTLAVIGCDGKSGLLSSVAARDAMGSRGTIVGITPDAGSAGARLLSEGGYADKIVAADARDALATATSLAAVLPEGADLVVNCVNVPGTEMSSILCARDGGTVYFFSMNTSFTAAALGAEGTGKDVAMLIGNGYAAGHATLTFDLLRKHSDILAYFTKRYATPEVTIPS